jgi:hypothetical protein
LKARFQKNKEKQSPKMSGANVRLFHLGHPLEVRHFCDFMKQKWQSSLQV